MQQCHPMAEALELATPVMCGAAGFEQHLGRRLLGEEGGERGTRQATPGADLAGNGRDGDFEDRLGEIDADL